MRWPWSSSAERTTGFPTSSNRASSFHLEWVWDGPTPALVEAAATLTVVDRPLVEDLHFWALQASFHDGGRRLGGGHTGLQWHRSHPGRTAVNWGGYGADGRELGGTVSSLPSATGNVNTRDWAWSAGVPARLRIFRGGTGWAASVDDVVIRELRVGGDHLAGLMVWSEVFAACDAPSSTVRWSDLHGRTAQGEVVAPVAVRTRYQSVPDGGCSTSCSFPDGAGSVLQRTATPRRIGAGVEIPIG